MTMHVIKEEARIYIIFLETLINHQKNRDLLQDIYVAKTRDEKVQIMFEYRTISIGDTGGLGDTDLRNMIRILQKIATNLKLDPVIPSEKLSSFLNS